MEPRTLMQEIAEMNSKLDAIMEHLGCTPESYMDKPDEEKDKIDRKEIMGEEDEG